jgi:hypothetical protein
VFYIGMSGLSFFGRLAAVTYAVNLSSQGGLPAPASLISGTFYLGLMLTPLMPLACACLYDLISLPMQVNAANMRAEASAAQSFGAVATGPKFGRDEEEEALAAKKADEVIARYLAQREQLAQPAVPAMPQKMIPTRTASAPTFGKHR